MKRIKIITLSLSLIALSALVFVGVANAQSFKTGNAITVATSETINSILFAAGTNIDIAGTVNGDVYCAGQTVTISGTVNGDVICAGQTIIVSGKIDGNVRLGGQNVTLSGTVGNSATIGAQDLIIDKDGIITRDLLGGSQNVTINGMIGRDIVAGSTNLTINGRINRNINGGAESLSVGSTGYVGGAVEYISNNDPAVGVGGKIVGTVTRTVPKTKANTYNYSPFAFAIGWFIYILIAMIITALVISQLFRQALNEAVIITMKAPGRTVLAGIIAMIFVPIIIFVLLMTVIGIPLAILTILSWIIIMIMSGPFMGYLLGRLILRTDKYPCTAMGLGIGILVITYFIPFIGLITMFLTSLFGVGMIIVQSKKLFSRKPQPKK